MNRIESSLVLVTKDDLVIEARQCPEDREKCADIHDGTGTFCGHFLMFIDEIAIYCLSEKEDR